MYEDLVVVDFLATCILILVAFSAFIVIAGIVWSVYTEIEGRRKSK